MIKITISTPCFNSEKTIEETIKSIVSQDYPNLEYNIIDGASTDATLDIVSKYRDKIHKVISEKDKGISDAFNKGVLNAEGELIGNINSDDLLLPDALRTIAEEIEEDTDVVYGDGLRLFDDGTTKPYKCLPIKDLYRRMALVHPAVFVRRKCYDKFGVFDLNYKGCMDRDLLLRMLFGGAKFQYIEKPLIAYRMGGFSDKNYFRYTLPEGREISIKYGMPKWKANFFYIKGYLTFKVLGLMNKLRLKK